MDFAQAFLLGVLQALTEFLPISSSGHLVLAPWLLGWEEQSLTFDVALHLGTALALLLYFFRDWTTLLGAALRDVARAFSPPARGRASGRGHERVTSLATPGSGRSLPPATGSASLAPPSIGAPGAPIAAPRGAAERPEASPAPGSGAVFGAHESRLFWLLVAASVPAGVAGLALESYVERSVREPTLVAVLLIVFGLVLLWAERRGKQARDLSDLTLRDALLIGVAQAVALAPGVSRSGVTITVGLLLDLRREAAARFSFLLSTPVIVGAAFYQARHLVEGRVPPNELPAFGIGIATALVVGLAVIHFFLRFVRTRSLALFVYYRVAVGLMVLALALLR